MPAPSAPERSSAMRALADQPAGADDDHAVDGLLDLGQQVAGDQHGAALLVGQVPQEAAQPLDALGVQAVGRLVEHQDRGVAEQRGRPAPAAAACRASSRRRGGGRRRSSPTSASTSSARGTGSPAARQ